jgi:hypothetical protein
MTGGRLAHLHLQLGSRSYYVGPTTVQRRDAKSCAFVNRFTVTSTEWRIPDGPVKLTVHVRSATVRQRIIFALSSPHRYRNLTRRDWASPPGLNHVVILQGIGRNSLMLEAAEASVNVSTSQARLRTSDPLRPRRAKPHNWGQRETAAPRFS